MAWGAEDYLHAGELARAIANLRGNTDGFGHFGTKIGVEMRFEKKQPVRTCRLFSQIYTKNHRFGHLEPIWNGFGRSKYLVVWAFGPTTNYGRHPSDFSDGSALGTCYMPKVVSYSRTVVFTDSCKTIFYSPSRHGPIFNPDSRTSRRSLAASQQQKIQYGIGIGMGSSIFNGFRLTGVI